MIKYSMLMNNDFSTALTEHKCETFISILFLVFVIHLFSTHQKMGVSKKQGSPRLPPYAEGGYIETLQKLSSNEAPLEFARWAKGSCPLFRLRLPFSTKTMVANDLSLFQKILGDPNSYKPSHLYEGFIGETMFSAEGQRWKHVRKSVTKILSSNSVQEMNDIVIKMTNKFMTDKLDIFIEKGEPFDLCYELLNLTLSTISTVAFGYSMSQDEKDTFLEDMRITLIESRYRVIPFRKQVGKFIPNIRRAQKCADSLLALGNKILRAHRVKEVTRRGTIIDCIVNDQAYESDAERVKDLIVFLVAGHDTTAYSLAWILLELAKNPNEQNALRDQLNKTPLTKRHQCDRLKNVIKEGMRLHPVGALGSIRKTAKEYAINLHDSESGDVTIPKDSTIFFSFFLLMRNPRYFDNPEKFIPSRWENPSPEALSAFLPFSSGRRNCVGQALAKIELCTILSHIISKYHFKVAKDGKREFYLTMKPSGAWLFAFKGQNLTT